MSALVLEGGTFRTLFSCGVMDALLDSDIHFPYVIGVSAGIANGVSYVSRQRGRNYDMFMQYRRTPEYLSFKNIKTEKSPFGVSLIFEKFPQELYPFDFDTFRRCGTEVKVVTTDAESAEPVYFDGSMLDSKSTILKASCAQPFVFPPVYINGRQYFDGGVSDSIPAKKAYEDGHHKQLIVLTRTPGFKLSQDPATLGVATAVHREYPEISRALLRRDKVYNQQLAYVKELEDSGDAVVLRPAFECQVSGLESNLKRLDRLYKYGYELTMNRIDEIRNIYEAE